LTKLWQNNFAPFLRHGVCILQRLVAMLDTAAAMVLREAKPGQYAVGQLNIYDSNKKKRRTADVGEHPSITD